MIKCSGGGSHKHKGQSLVFAFFNTTFLFDDLGGGSIVGSFTGCQLRRVSAKIALSSPRASGLVSILFFSRGNLKKGKAPSSAPPDENGNKNFISPDDMEDGGVG